MIINTGNGIVKITAKAIYIHFKLMPHPDKTWFLFFSPTIGKILGQTGLSSHDCWQSRRKTILNLKWGAVVPRVIQHFLQLYPGNFCDDTSAKSYWLLLVSWNNISCVKRGNLLHEQAFHFLFIFDDIWH